MKIKTVTLFIISTILIFLFTTTTWAKDPFLHHNNQKNRIQNGIKSGKITPHELLRLNNEQKRIRQYTRRAARDGHISRQEQRTIDRMQDRADKHIYEAKHNSLFRYRSNHQPYQYNRRNLHQKDNQHRWYDRHQRYHYHGRDKCYRSDCGHCGRRSSRADGYYFSGTWFEPGGFFSFSTGGKW